MATAKTTSKAQERKADRQSLARAVKADSANPESPLIYLEPEVEEDPPGEPEAITLKEGETAAQYETHVLLSGPAIVQERLDKEAEGATTDEVAREQWVRAAKAERAAAPEPNVQADDQARLEKGEPIKDADGNAVGSTTAGTASDAKGSAAKDAKK